MIQTYSYYSKEFNEVAQLDEWLKQWPDPEVVGYSAYGAGQSGDYASGVFITIKIRKLDDPTRS